MKLMKTTMKKKPKLSESFDIRCKTSTKSERRRENFRRRRIRILKKKMRNPIRIQFRFSHETSRAIL